MFVMYVLHRRHSYVLHVDTAGTLEVQKKKVTSKGRRLQIQMFAKSHWQDSDLEVPVHRLPWLCLKI